MEQSAQIFGLIALVVGLLSIGLQVAGKSRAAVPLLFLAGLFLALHSIHRDDYLHPWDERFHAVVALNAMDDPFHPKVFPEKVIDEWPYQEWYAAHTWLHKQPLFTWQMAIGMKIFGTSLAGMRSASVVMFLLLAFSLFRSVKLHFPKAAYWLTLFVICNPFLLFLVNGRQGIDHNDLAFFAYISLGFWGFVAFAKGRNWKWLLLLGVACGAAMLTKWLAGSLMLFVLGLYLLLSRDFSLRSWLGLLMAGAVALLVFLPWQFYAYHQWPELYMQELEYNARHLDEVLEGHEEAWHYHLSAWMQHFSLFAVLLAIAVFSLFSLERRVRNVVLTCILGMTAVLVFYSLAATKMMAFTIVSLPLAVFAASAAFQHLLRYRWWTLGIATGFTLSYFTANYVLKEQNEGFVDYQQRLRSFALELQEELPENAVIFNTPQMMFVDFIFYTHKPAYETMPSTEQLDTAKSRGYEPYILLRDDTEADSTLAQNATFIPAPGF